MTATDLLYEQPSKLIRDLSDAEFEERYNCERFTASVLGSRYRYIVQHMCTGLLNNAFSVILRDWYDFAATISGPPEHEYSERRNPFRHLARRGSPCPSTGCSCPTAARTVSTSSSD